MVLAGKLFIVATPIGNRADITQRALEVLAAVDVVLAEDTRVSAKLLSMYDIRTPLERCDDNVIARASAGLVQRMLAGENFAYVSDAGMPGVSDPGMVLVAAAREADVEVEVCPGPSALTTAIAGAGFTTTAFFFGGFLPRKEGEATRLLTSLEGLDALLVFYESPHRTLASLRTIAAVFPGREVCLARELTKVHEEFVRLPSLDLIANLEAREGELKGEVVLVIGPPSEDENAFSINDPTVRARMREVLDAGMSPSAAARQLATEYGVSKNVFYDALHKDGAA